MSLCLSVYKRHFNPSRPSQVKARSSCKRDRASGQSQQKEPASQDGVPSTPAELDRGNPSTQVHYSSPDIGSAGSIRGRRLRCHLDKFAVVPNPTPSLRGNVGERRTVGKYHKNWRKVGSEQSSYERRNVIENENPSVSLQKVRSVDGISGCRRALLSAV